MLVTVVVNVGAIYYLVPYRTVVSVLIRCTYSNLLAKCVSYRGTETPWCADAVFVVVAVTYGVIGCGVGLVNRLLSFLLQVKVKSGSSAHISVTVQLIPCRSVDIQTEAER